VVLASWSRPVLSVAVRPVDVDGFIVDVLLPCSSAQAQRDKEKKALLNVTRRGEHAAGFAVPSRPVTPASARLTTELHYIYG